MYSNICISLFNEYSKIGWSDFERKKSYTFYVVPNCCRTPIPKFHVIMLHFHLMQCLGKFRLLP